jgi:hypothetical protein
LIQGFVNRLAYLTSVSFFGPDRLLQATPARVSGGSPAVSIIAHETTV